MSPVTVTHEFPLQSDAVGASLEINVVLNSICGDKVENIFFFKKKAMECP